MNYYKIKIAILKNFRFLLEKASKDKKPFALSFVPEIKIGCINIGKIH